MRFRAASIGFRRFSLFPLNYQFVCNPFLAAPVNVDILVVARWILAPSARETARFERSDLAPIDWIAVDISGRRNEPPNAQARRVLSTRHVVCQLRNCMPTAARMSSTSVAGSGTAAMALEPLPEVWPKFDFHTP